MATSVSSTKTKEILHQEVPDSTKTMDDVSSNYQMRPNLNESFRMANIKDIIVDVLQQVLEGTFKLFSLYSHLKQINSRLNSVRLDKQYSSRDAANWSRCIVDDITKRIKDLSIPRYKHVAQVMLAEQTGAGSRFIARCLWDAECDYKISETYTTENIICIVTVFGVYFY